MLLLILITRVSVVPLLESLGYQVLLFLESLGIPRDSSFSVVEMSLFLYSFEGDQEGFLDIPADSFFRMWKDMRGAIGESPGKPRGSYHS